MKGCCVTKFCELFGHNPTGVVVIAAPLIANVFEPSKIAVNIFGRR